MRCLKLSLGYSIWWISVLYTLLIVTAAQAQEHEIDTPVPEASDSPLRPDFYNYGNHFNYNYGNHFKNAIWQFEFGLQSWEKTGTAFNSQPTYGPNVVAGRVLNGSTSRPMPLGGSYWRDIAYPIGHKGNYWIGTFENRPNANDPRGRVQGDHPTGTLTSPPFTISKRFITFLIGGGNDLNNLRVELLLKDNLGNIKYSDGLYWLDPGSPRTGFNLELLRREWWDVQRFRGQTARIRIIDNSSGGWGHINVDDFQFTSSEPTAVQQQFSGLADVRPGSTVVRHRFREGDSSTDGYVDWDAPVWGVSDLHTHPMSHLGFGKKLMFGAPDGDMHRALANCNCSHGGWGLDNECGNYLRAALITATDEHYKFNLGPPQSFHGDHPHDGYPNFRFWPHFTSITHQQMRVEWIERAYQGGLRVLVALAVNNHLLADAIDGDSPRDDKTSADLQIEEMKQFVARHDFMEIARSPAELRQIIRDQNKLAVILGIEVDNIGNLNFLTVGADEGAVRAEVRRLHRNGVRYIFPIHLTDNVFGGMGIYNDFFNVSNKFASVQPLPPSMPPVVPGEVLHIEHAPDPLVTFTLGQPFGMNSGVIATARGIIEAIESMPNPVPFENIIKPTLRDKLMGEREYQVIKRFLLTPDPRMDLYSGVRSGHRNQRGLTELGRVAINEMMRLGMIIDVDHMSEKTLDQALTIAEGVPGGYPLNSGHNGFRTMGTSNRGLRVSEHMRSDAQLERLRNLGGVMGVGWGYEKDDGNSRSFTDVINGQGGPRGTNSNVANTCGGSSRRFAQNYLYAIEKMGPASLGTDINGLVPTPGPRFGELANYDENRCSGQSNPVVYRSGGVTSIDGLVPSTAGRRTWDVNVDGVAHYGLLPDFLQDLRNVGLSAEDAGNLFNSSESFARMWANSVRARAAVP